MSVKSQVKAAVRAALEIGSAYRTEHQDAQTVVRLEKTSSPESVEPARTHLDRAIAWIRRAQDANRTGGVAWGYRARRPVRSLYPMGWVAPYPETTGYIIPTMLRYADLANDRDAVERARRMTEWEMSIQLPDGGIQGGIYGAQPVESSTFVTGQVLFGFVAAIERFGDDRVGVASVRAADWLLSCLDDTGRFARGYSHFCAAGAKAYESRTGYAVAQLGRLLGEEKYLNAASRMADYALSVQQANGWFAENDLEDHNQPLTHTIGYVMEGLHGIGTILNRQDCIDAVTRTLDAIIPQIQPTGYLAGRLRNDWSAAVEWACLTGSSQIAGVFIRMYLQTGKPEYLRAGRLLLGFVSYTQDLVSGIPGIDGGIRGSYPFSGLYCQWSVPNWASKFFSDSVMDYFEAKNQHSATTVLSSSV